MMLRSMEQDRAHHAMTVVHAHHATLSPEQFKEYKNRAQSLPSMIQNLGLAGTIAFLLSKGNPHDRLANDLAGWLFEPNTGVPWPGAARPAAQARTGIKLTEALCWNANNQQTSWLVYRQAAHEARLYGGWLKRWSKVLGG